jgi:hypothetical protein
MPDLSLIAELADKIHDELSDHSDPYGSRPGQLNGHLCESCLELARITALTCELRMAERRVA